MKAAERRVGFAAPLVLLALAILLGLGTWQVKRLYWKEGLIADIAERRVANPAKLSDIEAMAKAGEDIEYRRLSVAGKEGNEGNHTRVVSLHLRYGMIMFIASEVMFFVAWFWAYFDASLFPHEAIQASRLEYTGGQWPPKGIEVIDPWHLPLYNTVILLLSGTCVTWAHHALLHNDRKGMIAGLALTVALGVLFSTVQVYEYMHAPFDFKNSIYGATFFMATGFHGFHVFVGTVFLLVCLFRAIAGGFTPKQHFGFEAAAWYWHFVDVVWLFLFFAIYIWGGWGAPLAHG